MDLFCFASRNARNIELGIEHKLWAVGTLLHQSSMAARVTKAHRYLHEGACGLLYCNPKHAFTTPFIVRSRADPVKVVNDVWPEPWRLPFKIEPLGDLSRQMPADEAKKRWPFLQDRPSLQRAALAPRSTSRAQPYLSRSSLPLMTGLSYAAISQPSANRAVNRTRRFMTSTWRALARRASYLRR